MKQKAHIFDIRLTRSLFCPLSLRIEAETGVAKILAAVVPHRARWEHLELDNLSEFDLPIINGAMPLLRHLDLSPSNPSAVATEVVAPLLRTVVLNVEAASSVILPWAQLTSLTLVRVCLWDFVPILQQTSNLVRCELRVLDSGNDEPGPDIVLPYLESLAIVDLAVPVTDLLGIFIVPALRRLEIAEDSIEPDPIESLTEFISKSGCKLEKLHITGGGLSRQSYRMAFPSIRKFSFSRDDSSNSDASDSNSK
jgi:hypothetical protein